MNLNFKPVVLGSSLTGLLVSHSLSRRGIEHTVLGGERPLEKPRLGEAMNESSAVACWDLLGPEFSRYYYAKSHVAMACGDLAGMIAITDPNRDLGALGSHKPADLGFLDIGPRLVHIDRARFDPALYDVVRAAPTCRFVCSMVSSIEYDRESDRVTLLKTKDGQEHRPSVVFDGTGYAGLISKAVGLRHQHISRLQRVVWRHRYRDAGDPELPEGWWRHGTNLIRLDVERDGVNGIAWMIPLGDEVSIGVSVDAERHGVEGISDAALLGQLERAYEQRGMPVVSAYPHPREHQSLTHRYYARERAWGANWLLAGSAFMHIWFPSSTGVSTSTMAAYLAPAFIERPQEVGALYESRFRALMSFHELVAGVVDRPILEVDEMYDFWAQWLLGVMQRAPHDLKVASVSPRLPLRLLRLVTRTIGRTNLSLLAGMGFLRIRVDPIRQPSDWERAFTSYLAPPRFLASNVLRGWGRYLGAKLGVPKPRQSLFAPEPARAAIPGSRS